MTPRPGEEKAAMLARPVALVGEFVLPMMWERLPRPFLPADT
jgi:hypothetical protein